MIARVATVAVAVGLALAGWALAAQPTIPSPGYVCAEDPRYADDYPVCVHVTVREDGSGCLRVPRRAPAIDPGDRRRFCWPLEGRGSSR